MTKIEKKLNNMFLISDISRYTIYLLLFTLIIYIFSLNLNFKQDIVSFLAKVIISLFYINISFYFKVYLDLIISKMFFGKTNGNIIYDIRYSKYKEKTFYQLYKNHKKNKINLNEFISQMNDDYQKNIIFDLNKMKNILKTY